MRISAIIPLFNKVKYIQRAIDSVLAQSHADFELIVVNDGSEDGGDEVVRSYGDDRIRLFDQANAGVGAARNRGAAESQAEWIAFLDADDEWLPDFLATAAALIEQHPDAALIGAAWNYGDTGALCAGAEWLVDRGFRRGILTAYFQVAACCGPPQCCSSSVVRRDAFLQVGGFKVGVWGGEDPDLWTRLAIRYPVAYTATPLAIYHREMPEQFSNLALPYPYPPAVVSIRELDRQGGIPPAIRPDVMEYANRLLLWHIAWLLTVGRRREARRILRECRGTRRYRGTWWRQRMRAWLPAWLDRLQQNSRKR